MITLSHSIGDLERDMRTIAVNSRRDMLTVVAGNARTGARLAGKLAKRTAGKHGKHYPRSITSEVTSGAGGTFVADYGPDSSMPQGGMSFEGGSRNQRPHRDLARTATPVARSFRRDVADLPARWFW